MKVLVWNCQGVGSLLIVPQLREANNLFAPNIVFLSETKNRIKYMEKVKTILRFDEMTVVEAMNRAGGMTLMWNRNINVMRVVTTAFTIEAHVKDLNSKEDWLREEWSFKDFKEFIGTNDLVDIGFKGNPWTWSNNWKEEGEVRQRLDRGLSSPAWYQTFEGASCDHLETYGSDHSMLLFNTNPLAKRRKKRLTKKIAYCKVALLKWRNSFSSNSQKKINQVKQQLGELDSADCQDKKTRRTVLKQQL
ncbi:uncharacterized protein [Coffea arabica]|uniref:Endonuclease/exonuclease/phosphatase domain-containing protein n=1 Tax=Coffea arabica TaxID=13443 RepID=A0ABM4W8F6_COFAR